MPAFSLQFLLFVSFFYFLTRVDSILGVNYGQVGNNLPLPDRVARLLTSVNLTKVRIYDTNPQVLMAFANTGIELTVTVENEKLGSLADPQQAFQWVDTRIRPYVLDTRIAAISVGNEVYKGDGDMSLISSLVPAMTSLRNALSRLGLAQDMHISTPHSLSVLATSYPSSAGSFRPEIVTQMYEFLTFLNSTGSPFWINAYPYFAYKYDTATISLDYALSNTGGHFVIDSYTKLSYDSMLYAQVDAVIFAIYRLGFGEIKVGVSETGWPSRGDGDETGATMNNAAAYNRNLFIRQNEGTPLRPNRDLDIYLFALFNENLKPGPTSERNYGLYQPDETMVYNVGLKERNTNSIMGSTGTTVSLASKASKAASNGYKRIVGLGFVYLLGLQVLMLF